MTKRSTADLADLHVRIDRGLANALDREFHQRGLQGRRVPKARIVEEALRGLLIPHLGDTQYDEGTSTIKH